MIKKGKNLGRTAASSGTKVIADTNGTKTGCGKIIRDDIARHSSVKAVRIAKAPVKETRPVAVEARLPARVAYLDKAIERAKEILGGRDEALRWLGTPVAGLGYATPITVLGTKGGLRRVDDILTQIEHGVW